MRHQIGDTAAPEVPKEPPEAETGRVERLRRGRPEPPLPVQLAQVDVSGYLCPEFGVVLGPVAAHECDLAQHALSDEALGFEEMAPATLLGSCRDDLVG